DGDRAERHHRPRSVPIDGAADRGRHDAHDEEGDGEAEEDEAAAPAGVVADRLGQHTEAVVARAPDGDLGDAERADRDQHRVGEASAPGRQANVASTAPTRSNSVRTRSPRAIGNWRVNEPDMM